VVGVRDEDVIQVAIQAALSGILICARGSPALIVSVGAVAVLVVVAVGVGYGVYRGWERVA
jgi:hypothetical protein